MYIQLYNYIQLYTIISIIYNYIQLYTHTSFSHICRVYIVYIYIYDMSILVGCLKCGTFLSVGSFMGGCKGCRWWIGCKIPWHIPIIFPLMDTYGWCLTHKPSMASMPALYFWLRRLKNADCTWNGHNPVSAACFPNSNAKHDLLKSMWLVISISFTTSGISCSSFATFYS